jgi:hypothetical protein
VEREEEKAMKVKVKVMEGRSSDDYGSGSPEDVQSAMETIMDSISSAMTVPWGPSPVMTWVKRETYSSLTVWLLRKVLEVDFHRHVLLYPALPDLEAWVPETDSCTWKPRRVL